MRVDIEGFSLVDGDASSLVTSDVSRGLDHRSAFECTDGHGGEEGSEKEVVARADEDLWFMYIRNRAQGNNQTRETYDVVVLGLHILQHASSSPSTPENQNCLLRRIEWLLGPRVPVTFGEVDERANSADDGDQRHTTKRRQRTTPSRRAIGLRRRDNGGGLHGSQGERR